MGGISLEDLFKCLLAFKYRSGDILIMPRGIYSNRQQTKIRSRKYFGDFLKELIDYKEMIKNDNSMQFYNREFKFSSEQRKEWEEKLRKSIEPFYKSSNGNYITYSISELRFVLKIASALETGESGVERIIRKYSPKSGPERYSGFTCWLCGQKEYRKRPRKYGLCTDCYHGTYFEWDSEKQKFYLADMDTDDFPMWDEDAFVETLTESEAKAISRNMWQMWKMLVLPHLEEIVILPVTDQCEQIRIWKHPWEEYALKRGITINC